MYGNAGPNNRYEKNEVYCGCRNVVLEGVLN